MSMFRPSLLVFSALTLLALSPVALSAPPKAPAGTTAGNGSAASGQPRRQRHFRVNKKQFAARERNADGKFHRKGTLQVQVIKGRKARDFTADVTDLSGDGSKIQLALTDGSDGVTSTFAFAKETGTASVAVDGKTVSFALNPDGTISMDGKVYTDPALAGAALANNPNLAKLSPESYAAVDAVLSDEPVTEVKWEVAGLVAGEVVGVAADIIGGMISSAIDQAITNAGCDFGGWVWEWNCH